MLEIKENIPLSSYTVFKIGGPAKYFCEIKSKEEISESLNCAREKNIPFYVLGAGSNVLVSDDGFPGLVIKINIQDLDLIGNRKLAVGSGVSMARAVNFAVENGFGGFEWGIGIPGTIGGSVFGNSGCYGSEMKDIVESVEVLEVAASFSALHFSRHAYSPAGELLCSRAEMAVAQGLEKYVPSKECRNFSIDNQKCEFSYRSSVFKKHPERIILGATLNLKKNDQAESRKKIIEYTKKRAQTQDIGEKCAGCIFKNPKLDLAAAYLIDKAGLKGKTVGNAMVSKKHANYIVNIGGATSADVKNLIEIIKSEVKKVHGVTLEEEIRVI